MKYLITVTIIFCSFFAHSQNEVRLLDFTITPIFNINDTLPSDSLNYGVSFKIKNVTNTSQINLKLGTANQLSDVKEFTMSVVQSGGINYIAYNGQQYEVIGYNAEFVVRLANTQVQSTAVYSLQAVDNQGISTFSYLNNVTQ